MKSLPAKTVQESSVEMRELVMPHHANPHGTIFGGVVMSWIDMAAAMVATRHCAKNTVTVHVDSISFKAPIRIGDHVRIMAQVNYTGRTSMLIGVKVLSENPKTGESRHTTTAYLTFVAMDDIGRPAPVPPIVVNSEEEKRRWDEAKVRAEHNRQMRD
jgi:acyl-CoA hydrolase